MKLLTTTAPTTPTRVLLRGDETPRPVVLWATFVSQHRPALVLPVVAEDVELDTLSDPLEGAFPGLLAADGIVRLEVGP